MQDLRYYISRHIYWSEWGTHPRIGRANLDGSEVTIVFDSGLERPNGLSIYGNKIYVGDAGTDTVYECGIHG